MKQVQIVAAVIGLALLVGCAGTAASGGPTNTPEPPTQVEVMLTDFAVQSSITQFEAGKTYEFVITNAGTLPHEFVIGAPLDEAAIGTEESGHGGHDGTAEATDEEMHHDDALLVVSEEELPPTETVTVTYTFPMAAVGESLEIACHIPGHYPAGMRLGITVTH